MCKRKKKKNKKDEQRRWAFSTVNQQGDSLLVAKPTGSIDVDPIIQPHYVNVNYNTRYIRVDDDDDDFDF